MGVVRETERTITPDLAVRRGWVRGQHRRPAVHHSHIVLDCRIGMVEMKGRSRCSRRRLGCEAGMTADDLRAHMAAMRGLLDALPWHEGMLEQPQAHAVHVS